MSIRSRDLASPSSVRAAPDGRLQDLLLSAAFIASGPVLWWCGAAILRHQPDLWMQSAQLRGLHGIEAAEALLGLLAAASGLLISFGASIAVLAVLTQQIARRCGAWRMERVLAKFSPGFLRRSAALALGAGLALTTVAADSWPRATTTEAVSVLDGGAAGDAAGGDPDSALFDTTAPHDGPSPEPDRGAPSHPEAPDSGLFVPEAPIHDRLQGRSQRQESEPEQVVVRLGDSLWDIAAEHLGPDATDWEIAASWPEWYAVNRDRIGADPGIILPGTILDVPDS
ncbi:LysM peptidoglycan-binding domain-containing protein [Nesterenkonia sp. AY15]|uniref:LysM peptidoglycan-binding domain-containing protein n=1 Tax=Nesterenkonia sp. AY15 TaxID=2901139 RepID=UPI001F4CBF9E|nr:LysM domain-containing protein [Nesterenkonia sp. AY15]MCH8570107.1 LysM peptidoglycan-binding domain-containing protein [Nesterenkonia sp. AY15]